MTLAVLLLFTCMFAELPEANAAEKAGKSRAIAIVFDNSGSMYMDGNQAWCRATYAMEVFASMLNDDDKLLIYPMHPIVVGGSEYTMQNPYQVTDASQASTIRDIHTQRAGGTPIESIDHAIEGMKSVQADLKYLIVLTDGGSFSKSGADLSVDRTRSELDTRIQEQCGQGMTVMYLGIGAGACMPATENSGIFFKKKAENSVDVLSALTEMCNQIFGRDTLPKSHMSGNTMEFDITMSKLIVFVQGENISDVKVTGSSGALVGKEVSSRQTQYSTLGSASYRSVADTSLQGMMVTYADCAPGKYQISYSGTATSVEVYYEPDADLDFVFTDADGSTVDAASLYEGEYKVSFGIKDAKTGKLIESELLGNPHYEGAYYVSGDGHDIVHDGYSGEAPVVLGMGDTFAAELTVTYLSGYTITKSAADFGWSEGGIQVSGRPAGELRLEITGGDKVYTLQNLENGTPFTAKVFYQGQQVTGEDLERVDLKWMPETSNAEIMETFAGDHYDLTLHYKDPAAPQNTVCGECTVTIYAFYSAKGHSESTAECPITYNIEDVDTAFKVEVRAVQDYIVLAELENSQPIIVDFTIDGRKLTADEFARLQLQVDCSGLPHTLTPNEADCTYRIQLLPGDHVSAGDYRINASVVYVDNVGRSEQVEESAVITLSPVPLWVQWGIRLAVLLAALILLLIVLHIKVLPSHAHVTKKDSSMIFDGEDETKSTTFEANIKKGHATVVSKFAGVKFGVAMDAKAGPESFLKKSQTKRTAEVRSASVKKIGSVNIQEVGFGSVKYVLNEDTNKLERSPKSDKPFLLRHGMTVTYTGTMMNAGVEKPFNVKTKLNFK